MKKFIPILFILALSSFALFGQVSESHHDMDNDNITELGETYDATIYPNPVTDSKFKVKATNLITQVELINVIGQTIRMKNNQLNDGELEFYIPDCEKGVYLVKVTFENNNNSVIKKILVK